MENRVIIISGPTASGKTSTSLKLANKFSNKMNIEIINFDSLLFYKELNVGTAKPTSEEMGEIVHHMIDICSAKEPLNASDYRITALKLIQKLHSENKVPLLVGGSGFYLQALLKGMYSSQTPSNKIISRSDKLYEEKGIAPFLNILKENDSEKFKTLHENDHYRIRRAVEHFWSTGTPFSESEKKHAEQFKNKTNIHNWDETHLYLDIPKEQHWNIIERRAKKMLDNGLITEVTMLLKNGFTGKEKPLRSIGYKEVQEYLLADGKITREQLIENIFISTRQLAKAQRTWFNKVRNRIILNPLVDDLELNI